MQFKTIPAPYTMLATAVLLSVGQLPAAYAQNSVQVQTQNYQFDIKAKPLPQAIADFSAVTGVQVFYTEQTVYQHQAVAVQGQLTAAQALKQLLAGSDLVAKFDGSNSVTIEKKSAEDMQSLPVTRVEAELEADSQRTLNYSRADIEANQPQDVKQLFQQDAAVSVGGSMPVNQKIYVRGIEETAMAVNIDGARQNNKVFHHNATNLIDPALLKTVRASAGVAAADDGPGAIGGSLLFETVDVADLLDPNKNFGGFINARYASNGSQLGTSGALYGQNQGFELLGFVNKVQGDDYKDGEGNTVKYTEPGFFSGLLKTAYQSNDTGRFELSHETVQDDSVRPYRANFIALTAGRPTPESRNYDLARTSTTFNYNHLQSKGIWNPAVTLSDSETELKTTENPLSDPTTEIVYTGITGSKSGKFSNQMFFDLAEVTAGLDFYSDAAIFKFSGDPDLEEKAKNTGLFVQVRQPLGHNLDMSYGVRYDKQTFTGVDGSKHKDSGLSANLFADYQVNRHLSLNAGYGKIWGGIELAENFILNPDWNYTELKAVESNNYSLGLKAEYEQWLLQANTYKTKIDNARVPSWGGGAALVSDFEVDGYDLAVGYSTQISQLIVKYANIDSEINGETATSYNGNYFTAPLGEIITLSGNWQLAELSLSLGFDAEFTLENDAVETSGAKQKSYTVVNTYADYRFNQSLNFRLSVDNLTDEAYADRASYGQEFTTVVPFLEPGRSVNLNVRYQF
ncbi:TonB-dependent receptor [Catenovulum sp. 2E275]|uniref:TonB-dependent receptor n=1 Tax=Catenovulum sp. 2E275 TaxID=2980497 RepID=UPI0021D35DC2|nr:TonB-dependent receptor [Catenovulum sp. 2E275]MCU4675224.1 TonB-dependent receptor [Catenovulum sp. 2E275]